MSMFSFAQKGFKNPAATYCEMLGYKYSTQIDKQGNQVGMCTLPTGKLVNAWDFYKGKVAQEYSYAAKKGYKIETVTENVNGYVTEYAVCTRETKGIKERLSLQELMEKNGDKMLMETRGPAKDIYEVAKYNPNFVASKSNPTSFDWRSNNGHSYIGAVRDQGSCGSCYTFGANACAEGAYNLATGSYDSNTADFSEAYIAWCLGSMSAYSSHFSGCNGADYSYSELQALCDIGVIPESYFPYTDTDPQSCPSSTTSAPKTKFSAWYRVPCSDIEAIKTAIMTYGVVDVAVYVSTAWQNYSGGIFTDAATSCTGSPCENTTTNHAVALVGWGHDATAGDYWILRNSWGPTWGEGGYMRTAVTAARVACSVCYMVYQNTPPGPPTATTLAASPVTNNSATLNATVNPNNASTTVTFEYGLTTSYGTTVNATPNTLTGASVTSVTAILTGLSASTTYNFRVKAVNSYGTTYGSNMTFTTAPDPISLTLPVTENFATSTLPSQWTTQNVGTNITERWSLSNTVNAGGAAYELKCSYQQINPGTTKIISAPVNTIGVSQVTFSFKHMLDAYATGATLRLQTSTDKTNWTNTSWSVATTATNIAATTVNVPVTTNLNSNNTYFALVVDGDLYQIDYWYIDNISITSGGSTIPTVTTNSITNIAANSATGGGNVTSDGGATVTERGICYATTANPTTANSKIVVGSGTGTYTATMSGLTPSTTYYVRAFATNANGTGYGAQESFTTLTGGSVVTIGTGTSTQGYPLSCYYGYERSASLYTATELGITGTINKVEWYPTITLSYNIPIKIYFKTTTASTITASTWATAISGATLVYNGTMAGTTANNWKAFSLSTIYNYTGGTNNLLVLVETNYGSTGAGSSSGPACRYSTATSKHMYIRADNSAPTGTATVSNKRPNIRITFAGIASPKTETLDITENSNQVISAYPNPTTGVITVKSNGTIKSIDVYSITGAKILSRPNITDNASKEINLSNYNNGIYIIIVNDGAKNHTLKVTKQ